jgi:hypothetical protein|tara:strand:+ start:554 stop:733 length:180 start_codon:yes stop_codon:yes gene_type:complete
MKKEIKLYGFPRKKQRSSSFLTLLKLSPLVGANYAHIARHTKLNWRATREAAYKKGGNK